MHFVREKTLLEAVASSLTEMFSPQIISERIAGMLANYDFVTRGDAGLFRQASAAGAARLRFRARLREAPCQNAGAQQAVLRGARIQMRRAVGDARRAASCLCRARACPARRLRAEEVAAVSEPRRIRARYPADARPRLPRGVRLRTTRRRAAGCCWRRSGVQGRRDRGRNPEALQRRGDVRCDRRRARRDLQGAARADPNRCRDLLRELADKRLWNCVEL